MRKTISGVGLVAIGVLSVYGFGLSAQEPEGRVRGVYTEPGTYLPAGEVIAAVEATAETRGSVNMSHTVFRSDMSGAVIQLRTRRGRDLERGAHSMHPDDEVMYVVGGHGTLVTGGTLPAEGDLEAVITDGKEHHLNTGDWVIVPHGTAHFWMEIPVELTYIQMRLGGE